MSDPAPTLIEQLAWEGWIGGWTALALWLALAVVAAWFLWRERRVVGTGWAVAFWVLRVAAFGCALWMLAGPTQLRIQRTTASQSIAIFADGSESMEVVDRSEPADSVRWTLAVDRRHEQSALAQCDRLTVDLAAAEHECQRLAQLVNEHRPLKHLEAAGDSVARLLERASEQANAIRRSLDEEDASLAERASRIASLVDGATAESLVAIRSAVARSQAATGEDFAVRLEQLQEGITSARRRALVLAADLAQHADGPALGDRSEVDRLSRREKVGMALDAFEGAVADRLGEGMRIQRYRFDQVPASIGVGEGWAKSLHRTSPADLLVEPFARRTAAETDDDLADAGRTTNLSAVLEQLAGERPGVAARLAVILTDGRHNAPDVPAPQEVAGHLAGLPVYVVPIGNAQVIRDVVVHRVEAPSAVAEEDSAVIDVIVTGFDCDGELTSIVLRHEGLEIDRKPIEFSGDRGDQRARFLVPAKELGWQEYVVEVEPISDEANSANNYMPVSFEVVRDRTTVLLADSVARWEYRYLNQLFRRDERVDFDELLFHPRLRGTGRFARRPEFPQDVAGWANYDVVILGDVSPQQLSARSQRALEEYVGTRGGNLIVIAGGNSMPGAFAGQPLVELLPVERGADVFPRQGYLVDVTEEGRFHSALLIADSAEESHREWRRVYERFPVFGLSDYCRPKATARTLLRAVSESAGAVTAEEGRDAEHALLCWQRVGAGRVAYLAAPETWRLRFRRSDEMHHRFWGQFLRWITAANVGSGTDLVRLQTDRARYATGEAVEVTVWLRDAAGRPLVGESIQAEARTFQDDVVSTALQPDVDVPGRYFGTLERLPAGAYQIAVRGKVIDELVPNRDEQVESTITVQSSDSIELVNTQCNCALLEQVARITGGQVIPPTAISEVLQLVSFQSDVSEQIERTPLWNRWTNLLLVLGSVFTEWIVRKRKGFV